MMNFRLLLVVPSFTVLLVERTMRTAPSFQFTSAHLYGVMASIYLHGNLLQSECHIAN